jgi:hypothetical protein
LNDIIFLLYKNHSQSILQKSEYVI